MNSPQPQTSCSEETTRVSPTTTQPAMPFSGTSQQHRVSIVRTVVSNPLSISGAGDVPAAASGDDPSSLTRSDMMMDGAICTNPHSLPAVDPGAFPLSGPHGDSFSAGKGTMSQTGSCEQPNFSDVMPFYPNHRSESNYLTSCCPSAGGIISVPALFFIIALVVASACLAVVFLITITEIQSHVLNFHKEYGDQAWARVVSGVENHFNLVRKVGLNVQSSASDADIFDPSRLSQMNQTIQLLGPYNYMQGLHVLVASSPAEGLTVAVEPYFPPAQALLPQRAPYVIGGFANASNAFMHFGYFDPTTGRPADTLSPMHQFPFGFNFSTRPYAARFFHSLNWSDPFVALNLSALSCGIAFGGPFKFPFSTTYPGRAGTIGSFAILDFTADLVKSLTALKLTLTSRAMLFHTGSKVYIGGNIHDAAVTITNISSNPYVLTPIASIRDPLVQPILQHATDFIFSCTSQCSVIYDPGVGRLVNQQTPDGFITLFSRYVQLRVVAITDPHGLDLRVVVTMPARDFLDGLCTAVISGLILSASVLAGMLVLVGVVVYVLVGPLRTADRLLTQSFRHALERRYHFPSGHGDASCSTGTFRPTDVAPNASAPSVSISEEIDTDIMDGLAITQAMSGKSSFWSFQPQEVKMIFKALERMRDEMSVFRSFVPDYACGDDVSGGSRSPSLPGVWNSSGTRHHQPSTRHASVATAETLDDTVSRTLGANATIGDSLTVTRQIAQEVRLAPAVDGSSKSPVTFVVLDMQGMHAAKEQLLPTAILELHAEYLTVVWDAAIRHGGNVSTFYGDHVFVHFNAERRVRRHASAACLMMIDVTRRAKAQGIPPVAMGASTSPAYRRLMGSSTLRGFHVVGNCVAEAFSLARTCKCDITADCVVSWRTVQLAKVSAKNNLFAFIHRRLVYLPYDANNATITSEPVPLTDVRAERLMIADGSLPPDVVLEAVKNSNLAYEAAVVGDVQQAVDLMALTPWTAQNNWLVGVLSDPG